MGVIDYFLVYINLNIIFPYDVEIFFVSLTLIYCLSGINYDD